MVFEAGAVGLRTRPFERELIPLELVNVNESVTWWWRCLEVIPIKRRTFMNPENGTETTRK